MDDFDNLNQMQVIAKYRIKAQESVKIKIKILPDLYYENLKQMESH